VRTARLAAASLSGSSELSDEITDYLCIAIRVLSSLLRIVRDNYFEILIAFKSLTMSISFANRLSPLSNSCSFFLNVSFPFLMNFYTLSGKHSAIT
jgi:hypothetical protein